MEKVVSCCGVVCSDCKSYPHECKGCNATQGKVYWLEYTGGTICDIYHCCVIENKFEHCGLCNKLPCDFYSLSDPTKTTEENAEDLKSQLKVLKDRL